MLSDFDHLIGSGPLRDLAEQPLDEVRALRAECQAAENALSLVRRVIHGRLDIVGGEIARRNEGRDVSTLQELIESLPSLLSDGGHRGSGNPRPPQPIASSELADGLIAEMDAAVGTVAFAKLAELDDTDLAERVVALDAHEQRISRRRRDLHETIDALQAEITRRYRTGEATVDSLLS